MGLKKLINCIVFILFFPYSPLFSQTKYNINYNKPTKFVINEEYCLNNEFLYDVDFIDSNHHVVKSINRHEEENHHVKNGYDFIKTVTYTFYADSLISSKIFVHINKRTYNKKDFTYNNKGKLTGWISYYYKPKISANSFAACTEKDILLNFPERFPKQNLQVESKEERKYDGDKLVYKCYYETLEKGGAALPAREDSFKYNALGQIVEHISNPKSGSDGTAFLRQTFDYDEKGLLIRQEFYENNLHQSTDDYLYKDSLIIVNQKFYDVYKGGDPKKYSTMITTFKKQSDGNYYDERWGQKFSICEALD